MTNCAKLKGPSFGIIVAFLPACPACQHTKTLTDQLGSSPSHRYIGDFFNGFYHRESTFFKQQVPPLVMKCHWMSNYFGWVFSGDIFYFPTIDRHHEQPSFGNIFWFTCSNHLKQSKFYHVFLFNPPSTKPL